MQINNVSVIGAGVMGSGIATVSLIGGFNVNLIDIKEEFVQKAKAKIQKNLLKSVEKEVITDEKRQEILENLSISTDFVTVSGSDLIIEAVSENLDVKKKLFSQLNEHADNTAIIASNTSALRISELADLYKKPENVIGMHFFNPPVVMKLVELIRTEKTTDAIYYTAKDFVLSLQKEPVKVKESPGFIVNRVLIPMINEAAILYGDGVSSAEDIDKAMIFGANHPIGPLALADMIGIDVCQSIMETLQKEIGPNKYQPAPIFQDLINAGKLGKKSGIGFYDYNKELNHV